MAVGRGGVDDAAGTLRLHDTELVLHAEQRADNVGVEGRRVALRILLGHGSWPSLGAGVIDRRVKASEALDDLID